MKFSRPHTLWFMGVLVALSVFSVPISRAQECSQDLNDRRHKWRDSYSEYLGDGKFLDSWAAFPGCLDLPDPREEVTLKYIQIEETEDRVSITSPRTLFLDSEVFGELAYAILRAAQTQKPLLWELDSYGGWLEVTLVLLDLFHKAGTPVELVISEKSICYSACLLLTAAVENTYAHPDAVFGFHGASLNNKINKEGTERYLRLLIENGVNSSLIEALRAQGVFDTGEFHLMKARQLNGSGLFSQYLPI
jgi:hypothetical protein